MTQFRFIDDYMEAQSLLDFSTEWFVSFDLNKGLSLGARARAGLACDANYVSQPQPLLDFIRATPDGVYLCYLEPRLTSEFRWCGEGGYGAIFLPRTTHISEVEKALSSNPGRHDAAPISTYVEWGALVPMSRDWIVIFSARWDIAFPLFDGKGGSREFRDANRNTYFLSRRETMRYLSRGSLEAPDLFRELLKILPE